MHWIFYHLTKQVSLLFLPGYHEKCYLLNGSHFLIKIKIIFFRVVRFITTYYNFKWFCYLSFFLNIVIEKYEIQGFNNA